MSGGRAVARCTLTAAAMLACASSATAETFEVTRQNDPAPGRCKPGDCSLREAIIAANERSGNDVVVLPGRARYDLSRPNAMPFVDEDASREGDLDVTGRLVLRHPGRGRATIDANAIDRVLEVKAPAVVKRITLTGGDNVSEDAPRAGRRTTVEGSGGGIESHSVVKLVRSAVVANTGAERGGGISAEPDFTEPDPAPVAVRLVRSVVARNRTTNGTGGGIEAYDSRVIVTRSRIIGNRPDNAGGGLSLSTGSFLRMSRSTVAGNRAQSGVGGVYLYEASGSIEASTISGNSTGPNSSVGGIELSAGFGLPSNLSITNSTIAGNRAAEGAGGIRSGGSPAEVALRNVTVVRNDGDYDGDGGDGGGGIAEQFGGSISTVNSLIALNEVGATANDCETSDAFDSAGGNLVSVATGCAGFAFGAGDFLFADPRLGELGRNGGPTQTIPLRSGSPAIGKAERASAPNRDQRGVKRDRRPDIGAFER